MSNVSAKTVASSRTETSQVMTPNDANFLGKVFGGAILSMIDLCAYATASRFAGNVSVTASFDRVDFHESINMGEVVTCIGHVSYVGRTSMEITIEVYAEDVMTETRRHTNTARVTMVAIKENHPVEVPRLICETRDQKVAFLEGMMRRDLRAKRKEQQEQMEHRLHEMTQEELEEQWTSPHLESLFGEPGQ